jgi:tetratricopeptide (TPR) repeat protein
VLAVALLVGACASRVEPPPPPPPAPAPIAEVRAPPTSDEAPARFAQQQREAMALAYRQGRWVDSVWHAEVLLALDAQDSEARSTQTQARSAAAAAAVERLPRARLAQQRGEWDTATRLYLEILVMVPEHAVAADALREIERARTRRGNVAGYRSAFAMPMRTAPRASSADANGGPDRNDLEHASMLASQGELEAAIALLRPLATGAGADPAARAQLADLYFRQAQALEAKDRDGAIAALERCLQLAPGHRQAAAKLRTLRSASADKPAATP